MIFDDIFPKTDANTANVKTDPGYANPLKPMQGAWIDRSFVAKWKENMRGKNHKVLTEEVFVHA